MAGRARLGMQLTWRLLGSFQTHVDIRRVPGGQGYSSLHGASRRTEGPESGVHRERHGYSLQMAQCRETRKRVLGKGPNFHQYRKARGFQNPRRTHDLEERDLMCSCKVGLDWFVGRKLCGQHKLVDASMIWCVVHSNSNHVYACDVITHTWQGLIRSKLANVKCMFGLRT